MVDFRDSRRTGNKHLYHVRLVGRVAGRTVFPKCKRPRLGPLDRWRHARQDGLSGHGVDRTAHVLDDGTIFVTFQLAWTCMLYIFQSPEFAGPPPIP